MGCASSREEAVLVNENEKPTENVKKIKSLGKGNFGEVFLIKSNLDKKKSALKEIPIKNKNTDLLMNEGDHLKELDHPNLIHYKSVFFSNNILNVITEYAGNGDLNNELLKHKEQNKYFDEIELLNWLIQICLSLKYIHEKRIVHSDIKPSNIFLTKKNNIKLGDFGIFKRIVDFEEPKLYGAPELIKKNEYTTKADIWSLGVTFCHLLTLEYPFEGKDKNEIYNNIKKAKKKDYNDEVLKKYSKEFLDLIDEMMSLDPKNRPSAEEILNKNISKKRMDKYLKETGFDDKKNNEDNGDIQQDTKKNRKVKESVFIIDDDFKIDDDNDEKVEEEEEESQNKDDKDNYDFIRQMSIIYDQNNNKKKK